jgi:bifunctional non-homologous end joining protein LigD
MKPATRKSSRANLPTPAANEKPDNRSRRPRAKGSLTIDLPDAPKAGMPTKIKPMLAVLVDKPFDRTGWLFEVKWDGYRAIAEVRKRSPGSTRPEVRLYSRNQLFFEQRYQPVVDGLRQLGHEAVLDGEIIVLDNEGRPCFELLQNYQRWRKGQLVYYVFDLLYLDGHDLRDLPLTRRKQLLKQIMPQGPHVQFCEHVEEKGMAYFQAVSRLGLEGMVAKKGASAYRPGRRSPYWLKIKSHKRQEVVIGGFTRGRGTRKGFGALVLGVYDGAKLIHVGNVGSGFTTDSLLELRASLEPLIQEECPFTKTPATDEPVTWVKPVLVCEVKFTEWTSTGILRQPIFLGMRDDKPARAVRLEQPEPVPPGPRQATRAGGEL